MPSLKCVSIEDPQPMPIATMVGRLAGVTAITRHFAPEDVPRCRLCPVALCRSRRGCCTVLVEGTVPDEDAPLFDLHPTLLVLRRRVGGPKAGADLAGDGGAGG